ncbi:hypothetical protein AYI69_g1963 [Smittium culicis]|uniref:Uncharacterized protein n=1 Tax=Smittium culicis TaxID=133412 RepID=A0A1R1YNR8_9FUNG|nr:hypothetical protein AYI69_g1963 [Smittium culicis]
MGRVRGFPSRTPILPLRDRERSIQKFVVGRNFVGDDHNYEAAPVSTYVFKLHRIRSIRIDQLGDINNQPIQFDYKSWEFNQHTVYVSQSAFYNDQVPTKRSLQMFQHWKDRIEISDEPYLEVTIDFSRPDSWETDSTPTFRAQESSSVDIKVMDINCNSEKAGNSYPDLLEEPTVVIERMLNLTRGSRAGGIHVQNTLSYDLSFDCFESSKSTKQVDNANRMVSTTEKILCSEHALCAPQRQPVCLEHQQESRQILQLIPGKQSTGTICTGKLIYRVQKSIRFHAVESDFTDLLESVQGTGQNNISDTNVVVNNIDPGSEHALCRSIAVTLSDNSDSGPKNRNFSALRKQAHDLDFPDISGVSSKRKLSTFTQFTLSFPTNKVSAVNPGTVLFNIAF